MKDRLALFLKKEDITAVKFAEIMEVQPSSVSHLLAGRNKPNFDFVARMLARFPDLNPYWIINGALPVYKSEIGRNGSVDTNVNFREVTNVNPHSNGQELPFFPPDPKPALFDNPIVNKQDTPQKDNVTTVNTQGSVELNRPASPPRLSEVSMAATVAAKREESATERGNGVESAAETAEKQIERIVIFYSDSTFREYRTNR